MLKDGWVTIPFFPGSIGIETVRVDLADGSSQSLPELIQTPTVDNRDHDRRTAQFVRDTKGYSLIARGPGVFTIQATFCIPLGIEDLIHTLTFIPPPSVINRVTLRIPEKGVRLIQTEPAGRVDQSDNETAFQAVLSQSDVLKLSWRIEKDAGIVRKTQATLHSLTTIDKSAVTVFSKAVLKHIGSLDQIAFHVPSDVEIINVTSPNIDRWYVEQAGKSQVIRIAGQSDRHADVEISLSYRVQVPALPAQISIPMVEVHGVDMLDGFVGVEINGNLEAVAESVKNGSLIPAKNLPKTLWN